jgi:hypothetical protein
MKPIAKCIPVFLLLGVSYAQCHPLSNQECLEGGDFIRNAALSRDNGVDGITFVAKVLDDLVVIRSFPKELRWFAQDREDEDYLLAAVSQVFENRKDPDQHRQAFYAGCVSRIAATTDAAAPPATSPTQEVLHGPER